MRFITQPLVAKIQVRRKPTAAVATFQSRYPVASAAASADWDDMRVTPLSRADWINLLIPAGHLVTLGPHPVMHLVDYRSSCSCCEELTDAQIGNVTYQIDLS